MRVIQVLMFVGVISALGAALPAPASAQQSAPTSPTVSTQGEAVISVAPDEAWASFVVESRAAKPAEAQAKNAADVDRLRSVLQRAGAAADDIKSKSYALDQDMQYANGKSTVIGYIVRHTLEVHVADLKKLGAYLDAAGQGGATSGGGIRYDVKARDDIEARALAMAVQDGVRRAHAIAAAAGKDVQMIWRIDEQRIAEPRPMVMGGMAAKAMMAPAPTEIAPNDIEIRAQVTVTAVIR